MIDFKEIIAKSITETIEMEFDEIYSFIEEPKDITNGDYAFPCFRLAKTLKKAPQAIADEIKEKIEIDNEIVEKIEVINGYLNFYINKNVLTNQVVEMMKNCSKEEQGGVGIFFKNIEKYQKVPKTSEKYQKHPESTKNIQKVPETSSEKIKEYSTLNTKKTVVIDYSSPNIAKPFHIGHLKTTVIGGALYNIYIYLGYNVIGVNHLGDYGTQFGKLIEGYKRWGTEYDLSEEAIDKLADIYKRINELCKEDESVLEQCRENFKLLENGDEYCTKIWNEFKDLSIKEFQKIYNLLGSKFDSWNGEAFYADKTDEVIDILEKTGKLQESEGAKIIDLSDKGIDTPCIICKSNGSTIYATRDLAAILYRARTYDFDKCIYVTSYEQNLHFRQIFEVAKLMGLDEKYTNGLEHVPYGFVRLTTGKMSTREGNFVKVEDLLNDTIKEAEKIIEEKNPNLENKKEVAKKVGIGAVIFNDLATSRIKDEVFDINEMLNFQGETGPYIQYTYVRTKSVLEKIENLNLDDINVELLQDEYSQKIVKLIYNFINVLEQVIEKSEPSILARYLIDLAKAYSGFYNENKVICDDELLKNSRAFLTYATGKILEKGAELLGIEMPEKM